MAFCRHFCRLYARALVSKEEEERSPSFFFSLSLTPSRALLHRVAERSDDDRSRGEGEREGGGASTASRFGKEFRRYARLRLDFSKSLISFFFIAGVRGRGSTLKTRGGIQQSVEKRQSRHY